MYEIKKLQREVKYKMYELRDRVKKCKEQMGISYKAMSEKCGVPYTTFYSFTGGVRKLPQEYVEKIQGYLEKIGY